MSDIKRLEQHQVDNKAAIERRDIAIRLAENHDFRKLILDYFMKEECARYVHSSADPALNPESRADALAIAQAAGHLKRFLQVTIAMGNNAEGQMGDIEDALTELRSAEDQA